MGCVVQVQVLGLFWIDRKYSVQFSVWTGVWTLWQPDIHDQSPAWTTPNIKLAYMLPDYYCNQTAQLVFCENPNLELIIVWNSFFIGFDLQMLSQQWVWRATFYFPCLPWPHPSLQENNGWCPDTNFGSCYAHFWNVIDTKSPQ